MSKILCDTDLLMRRMLIYFGGRITFCGSELVFCITKIDCKCSVNLLCISFLKKLSFHTDRYWRMLISVHEHVILPEHICHFEGVSRILLDYFLYICLFSMSLHFRFIVVNWRLGGSSKLELKFKCCGMDKCGTQSAVFCIHLTSICCVPAICWVVV